ncbi:hypothetical protein A6A27_32175 [Micromonospora sp. CB01531]|nr:hypothetical protein A6A27_32175 [Micromonospora sp. CB01531]
MPVGCAGQPGPVRWCVSLRTLARQAPLARASRPVLNASLEHSGHHGATSALAAFRDFRRPTRSMDIRLPGLFDEYAEGVAEW